MIKIIATVDGDWKEYSMNEFPVKERMLRYISNEIKFFEKYINGKYIHFIHTSPIAETHFFEDEYNRDL